VVCDQHGLAVFERLRHKHEAHHVLLYAFDLLELDGEDLRREPFETRKATLTSLLRGCLQGLRLNEHLAQPGDLVFRHACKLGCEGIVSKRLGSRYRSGRSPGWLKVKNPAAPAGEREGGEGLGPRVTREKKRGGRTKPWRGWMRSSDCQASRRTRSWSPCATTRSRFRCGRRAGVSCWKGRPASASPRQLTRRSRASAFRAV